MKTNKFNFKDLYSVIWTSEEPPKAVLQIVHGMTEHIDRYETLAENLTTSGIVVAGFDLPGHGHNNKTSSCASLGEDGWEKTLEAIDSFHKSLKEHYPDIPHIILGFSLGSFIVRDYLSKYKSDFSAAVIAGTGDQPSFVLSVLKSIVNSQINKNGFDNTTPLVKKLSFETYNEKFKPVKTSCDWLCSDEIENQKYIFDILCKENISSGLFWQLLDAMKRTGEKSTYSSWKEDLPVLLLSGENDPVGDFGKGVSRTENKMRQSGINNLKTVLFPNARHDIFHEIENGTFYDVVNELDNFILSI